MPKDKITSESRMRENRTFGLMRGREVYRPTLPTLLLHLSVGLLINFGAATLKEGLHRVVNHLDPSASPHLRVNRSSQND